MALFSISIVDFAQFKAILQNILHIFISDFVVFFLAKWRKHRETKEPDNDETAFVLISLWLKWPFAALFICDNSRQPLF